MAYPPQDQVRNQDLPMKDLLEYVPNADEVVDEEGVRPRRLCHFDIDLPNSEICTFVCAQVHGEPLH